MKGTNEIGILLVEGRADDLNLNQVIEGLEATKYLMKDWQRGMVPLNVPVFLREGGQWRKAANSMPTLKPSLMF